MSITWDPNQYLRFEDARGRPFRELVARIPARVGVERVFDLGCGPGNMTASLLETFPDAHVTGVDNSPEMIERAGALAEPGRLDFALGDVMSFTCDEAVQVLVSNATLQWVPNHLGRFGELVGLLDAGGSFAFQVPTMADAPSHRIARELASSPRWRDRFGTIKSSGEANDASTYLETLMGLNCVVDAWETVYYQVLSGEDAVLEWTRGTSFRPYLEALSKSDAEAFTEEYRLALKEVYEPGPAGTVFPFRRTFVVATKAG